MAKTQNYDSDFCGSLPLHHINVIQDYGYLLVLEPVTFKILQFSDNLATLLGQPVSQIAERSLADFADVSNLKKLQERFNRPTADKFPFNFQLNGRKMLGLAHFRPEYLVVELELMNQPAERTFTNVFEEIRYAISAIEQADSIEEVSQVAIHELRLLTGFDGIMMYQFDADWNGTVIAEEKVAGGGLENYLGHTFPASDIPKQARQLYLQNPYRLIPNRDYKAVQLYPVINPATNTFTDMSACNVRGVAGVHLEYLKNMNVQASMSIRVIHQGQLWGLIACHQLKPHYLSLELCSVCELLSAVISNKISSLIYKAYFDRVADLQKKHTAVAAQVYQENNLINGLLSETNTNLADIFNAGGAAVWLNGKLNTVGQVPDAEFIENMLLWLQNKNITQVYATDQLPELYEDALPFANIASGALIIPVDAADGDFAICFRPEVVRTIKWGGDPNQAINFEKDGKNYHPRNSFKIWQQTVRNTSIAWSDQELETAESLRSFIFEFITRNNRN